MDSIPLLSCLFLVVLFLFSAHPVPWHRPPLPHTRTQLLPRLPVISPTCLSQAGRGTRPRSSGGMPRKWRERRPKVVLGVAPAPCDGKRRGPHGRFRMYRARRWMHALAARYICGNLAGAMCDLCCCLQGLKGGARAETEMERKLSAVAPKPPPPGVFWRRAQCAVRRVW